MPSRSEFKAAISLSLFPSSVRYVSTSLHSLQTLLSAKKFHRKTSSNSRPLDSRIVIAKQPSNSTGRVFFDSWFLTRITWCAPNSICDVFLSDPTIRMVATSTLVSSNIKGFGPSKNPDSLGSSSIVVGKKDFSRSTIPAATESMPECVL